MISRFGNYALAIYDILLWYNIILLFIGSVTASYHEIQRTKKKPIPTTLNVIAMIK